MRVEVGNVGGDVRRGVHLHGVHELLGDGHLHLLVRSRFGESHVHLRRLCYVGSKHNVKELRKAKGGRGQGVGG